MLSIILALWGHEGPPGRNDHVYKFGPDDALRMAAQIRANLKLPHELVLVTDFPQHLFPSDLRYVSIAEHFAEVRQLGGCYLRLQFFQPGMSAILGPRIAWLDLDSVVTGDLDPLFGRREPLVLYRSDSLRTTRWNGSFVLGDVDANAQIWTRFDMATSPQALRDMRALKNTGPRGTDQAWLHTLFDYDTPHVSSAEGIYHWGRAKMRALPENARVVTFAGAVKMNDPKAHRYSPWLRQHWPLGDDLPPGMTVAPWPVRPMVEPAGPGRFKTLLKQRQEARAERRRMLNAGQLG